MSGRATGDPATFRRRLAGVGVLLALGVLMLSGLPATASAAGKIATTIADFPLPTSHLGGPFALDDEWSPSAGVNGPYGRPVRLEIEDGFTWRVVAVVKTTRKAGSREGSARFTVKNVKAGSYRLVVPAKGRYAAKTSGVQTLAYFVVPEKLSGSFSGSSTAHHVEWSGVVSLSHDLRRDPADGSPGPFNYKLVAISGFWHATDQVDPNGTTYSGSGPITLENIDAGWARDRNFWNPFPTSTSPFAGGRYNFSQAMPLGQQLHVTVVRPGDRPLITNFSLDWIKMDGFPVEEGYPLPSAVDLDHLVGSYPPADSGYTTSWDLTGDSFYRYYYFVP